MVVLCFLVHDFDHVKGVLPGLRLLDLSCLETMNPVRGIYGAMIGEGMRRVPLIRRLV